MYIFLHFILYLRKNKKFSLKSKTALKFFSKYKKITKTICHDLNLSIIYVTNSRILDRNASRDFSPFSQEKFYIDKNMFAVNYRYCFEILKRKERIINNCYIIDPFCIIPCYSSVFEWK